MALPSHSPTRTYGGPGSPPRVLTAYPDPQLSSHMYNHQRSMLPPSPQHYQPRFPATVISTPAPSLPSLHDVRTNAPPYKRPGSSMSISSMLGGEPDRLQSEPRASHHTRTPSQPASLPGPSFSTGAHTFMSPPQQPARSSYGEYSYKPRSRTPDRMSPSFSLGPTRQRSSSSGTAMQRPGMFEETHHRSSVSTPAARFPDPIANAPGTSSDDREREERYRRTSLSGVLQRPSSQPQASTLAPHMHNQYPPQVAAVTRFEAPSASEAPKANGTAGSYDTKPPGMNGPLRTTFMSNPSPPKSSFQSVSPELPRSSMNGSQGRGLASILNGPTSQPMDSYQATSQKMARQDSTQSHSDRSGFGEKTKFRAYSPFNASFTSNPEESGRKGSDELSQHRTLLGLAAENKRGRYSPMPQAVQGAQAQTPVPDPGVKTERGRVFSGLGGGVSTTPLSTSGTTPSSPFKKDEGPMRLSEDNLRNFSRSTAGVHKRSRKTRDGERTGESEAVTATGEKSSSRKKGKHQHNYKADLEEMAQAGFPRRNGGPPATTSAKQTGVPGGPVTASGSYQSRTVDVTPIFRPKKKISVAAVFQAASKNPRRHLGNYTYRPAVEQGGVASYRGPQTDVSISPNLLPSFTEAEHVNCTYTIHVPNLWLRPREKGLICAAQHLWGSGIYTDDSDPVAAAVHAGFLQTCLGDAADGDLFAQIVHDQNPIIEYPPTMQLPAEPVDVDGDKDLNITMLVLPLLERYEGSTRFGLKSRTWPGGLEGSQHDGVSFGILGIEFVKVGAEELRVGRTGQGRRSRLQRDLEGRRRGLLLQQHKIAIAKKRHVALLQMKLDARPGTSIPRSIPKSVPPTRATDLKSKGVAPSALGTPVVPAVA